MAEWDAYWIVSQALNLMVFGVFFITMFLIPSKDKVRSGEAGQRLGSPTIPLLIVLILLFAIGIPIFAVAMVEDFLIVLGTDCLLLVGVALVTADYFSTRKLYKEITAGGHVQVEQVHIAVTLPPGLPPHHQQAGTQNPQAQHLPSAQHDVPQGAMMTVECPNCSGHIQIPEGSSEITCPYCGLSGSM